MGGENGKMVDDPVLGTHMVHDIQCAEMCGTGHGIMNARIHILETEDYLKWQLANQPSTDQLASN